MINARAQEPRAASRPARVLIVEDESIVALGIQAQLESLGYEVAGTADSAESAVRRALAVRPELILMDIRLRGSEDGVAAARNIRERMDVPVVFLTAYGDMDTVRRVLKTNPYGYVLKPFSQSDLLAAIEVALHRYATDAELKRARAELETRARRAASIADLGLSALRGADFNELATSVARKITSDIGMALGLVLEAGRAGAGGLRNVASSSNNGFDAGAVITAAEPYVDEAVQALAPVEMAADTNAGGLVIPIEGQSGPWGVLIAIPLNGQRTKKEDTDYLQAAANILSTARKSEEADQRFLEVSSPVLPLDEGLLLVPLVGTMDRRRTRYFASALLRAIRERRARVIVIDVTGLGTIDRALAGELLKIAETARLLGARTVMCGISSALAQELVGAADPLVNILSVGDLRSAIAEAERMLAPAR